MVTLEQVEKLCERANVSYDEAKAALEATNGDVLEALINLERQGKAKAPQGGGQYASAQVPPQQNQQSSNGAYSYAGTGAADNAANSGATFSELCGKFFRWCGKIINKGNVNALVVAKNDSQIMKLPVTVLVLLLIFAFWLVIPLMIIGLFCGYRYFFCGPDLEKTSVNKAMDSVADAADNLKHEVTKQ